MNDQTQFDPAQIPPPLLTNPADDPFAHRTIAIRKPAILDTVLADHVDQYPKEIVRALRDLRDELARGRPVRPLHTTAPDGPDWAAAWQVYQNKTWFNIPWYFAEVFFYRRLLEAVQYFGPGPWAGIDPFLPRKQAELAHDVPWQVLRLALEYATNGADENLGLLLRYCVWGNRVDLSHPQIVEELRRQAGHKMQGDLLADDTDTVLAHLQEVEPDRIDFVCDNAGTELLLDLALADFLLRYDWSKQITLHIKAHPTYVSDTTPADIELTLAALHSHSNDLAALAGRVNDYRDQGRLHVRADLFWNSHRFFWEIPSSLLAELTQAQLVIFKGDANYRRLLGDAHWPADTPFAQAIPYFPVSFVTLRTMKSDVVVGLQPGQAEALDRSDPDWRVNGKRAVIQAVI